jgi:hypothetical protein
LLKHTYFFLFFHKSFSIKIEKNISQKNNMHMYSKNVLDVDSQTQRCSKLMVELLDFSEKSTTIVVIVVLFCIILFLLGDDC